MPRVKPLGKPNREKILGAEIDCAITKSFMSKEEIADMTGVSKRMLYYRIEKPQSIKLDWLKMFIKVTNMKPEVILDYLYDGKYERKEQENV